jgi:hypothetical protein
VTTVDPIGGELVRMVIGMGVQGVIVKRIVLSALTVALSLGVTVAPAQAGDERRCVSQREYRDVQRGWRQARVADHFDMTGIRMRRSTYNEGGVRYKDTLWKYRKCSAWGPGGDYAGIWYINYSDEDFRYMRVWRKAPMQPHWLWDE